MPRHARNQAAATDLGKRLIALRRHAGNPPYSRIARDIEFRMGVRASDAHIRELHRGTVDPHVAGADVLMALAAYYLFSLVRLVPSLPREVGDTVTPFPSVC